MEAKDATCIAAHFDAIEDPRRDRGKLHKLNDILIIAICATIGGAEGWDDIAAFGRAKQDWFEQRLDLEHGIPSADTFRRVIALIKPRHFAQCFLCWVNAVVQDLGGDRIAIDGKTLKGSYDHPKAAIHMVSAWANEHRLVLAQEKVDQKTNEITAIPALLEVLDLEGCIVTLDAMGTQREIAQQIHDQGADYVLALKANHGILHAEVVEYFEDAKARYFKGIDHDYAETLDLGHARRERRRCLVSGDVTWLRDYAKWAGFRSLILVESERATYTKETVQQRYFISSLAPDAAKILAAVRGHWGIENQLHWVLDVSFSEDACRIRRNNGAENFSVLRRIALNVLRQDTESKLSLKAKRKTAGWNNDYLARILRI